WRIAAAGGAPWPKVSSDCATALTATVLIPSALRPLISCRRHIPLSRYCLISSFMVVSSPLGGVGSSEASTTGPSAEGPAVDRWVSQALDPTYRLQTADRSGRS